jgi:hypothetical protein
MFNDLRVSNAIEGQIPQYLTTEYPNFVNFLKDYYRYLETNSNALDLINGLQDLVDVDTYSGVDLTGRLKTPVSATADEIVVLNHVEFPRTNGLLKINDEVIFYKSRDHITDEAGAYKLTIFSGCVRGFTYNDLDLDNGFTPNITTTPSLHSATSIVYNQSYQYILYFLEKLRRQYLADFPKNVLQDNIDKVNINVILEKIKDFYLTKGTPQGIDFYFKFLFQEDPELINYSDYLMAPSSAIYQSKQIIRVSSLDGYFPLDLEGNSLVQGGKEFPVQTVEDVFSFSSQVYELEISNGSQIEATKFTILTSNPFNDKLFVDSTYGFPDSGFLRINDGIIEYTDKESNYFICPNLAAELSNTTSAYGDRIYDITTLASVKDRPDSYFVIYAGVSGFEINRNYTYYQKGDIGYISDIVIEDSLLVSGWYFNDLMPLIKTEGYVSGVKSVYTDEESIYLYSSGLPYYPAHSNPTFLSNNDIIVEESNFLKRIPKKFFKNPQNLEESTVKSSPVGFLRDGTAILNWKSSTEILRGGLDSVIIENNGDFYNVHNPPSLTISEPTIEGGTKAEAEIVVNGEVKDVFIVDSGQGYSQNISISVIKDPTDTKYTGDNFRPAVLQPILVKGKITKIRIVDSGKGYAKQPTVQISPNFNVVREDLPDGTTVPFDAQIELFVAGPVGEIVFKEVGGVIKKGSLYDVDPTLTINKGTGASGVVTVTNGKITGAQVVNGGQQYNSAPLVRIIDSSGEGIGGVIISEFDAVSKQVTGFKVLNGGFGYSTIGTRIELYESGDGLVADPQVTRWNLISNWDVTVDPFYDNDSGAYLYGEKIIQEQEAVIPRFELIPYIQYSDSTEYSYFDENGQVVNSRRMLVYNGNANDPNASPINPNPLTPVLKDGLIDLGYDILDEATLSYPLPFPVYFGSSSTNPSGAPEDGYLNISSNGFITFSTQPLSFDLGWATEQLSPTSIGPSIQIGRDDLVVDQVYSAVLSQGEGSPRLFLVRFEGYHFDRGITRDKEVVFEFIIKENLIGVNDNEFQITTIKNEFTALDDAGIYITFADDENYEFEKKPATAGTTYFYYNEVISETDPKFAKEFAIIGAPKKLKLLNSDNVPVTVNLTDQTVHSPLIGWALDGAPIYGPYGYENALDSGSPIKKMVSIYRKRTGVEINNLDPSRSLPSTDGGLNNYSIGSFEQDYIIDPSLATLDNKNGRYCVTPEYPNGVYAYFMTVDLTNKRNGFPYFIGSKYSGKTYANFNNLDNPFIESIKGIRRYVNPSGDAYPFPIDVGRFQVSSVPTSGEAYVESINIVSGGSGYKFGDVLEFNNEGTDGNGAAGFVSVLRGKSITSTSFDYYDYLEYDNENFPFVQGSTIKSFEGFSAEIHTIDQNSKKAYLTNVSGPLPSHETLIYDTNLTVDESTFTELVGPNISTATISSLQTTAELVSDITPATSYFELTNFANCAITDFFTANKKSYIKINDEYMSVVYVDPSTDYILVKRGYDSETKEHKAGDTVTLMYELDVFDSSSFVIGDLVKVDDEVFRILDIVVEKQYQVVSTRIVDGSGTFGGSIYYLYLNQQLQSNTTAITPPPQEQQVVVLDSNGDIEDLVFDTTLYTYEANPVAEITTQSTYNKNDVVPNTNILATTFKHTLIVDRSAFGTTSSAHIARSKVNRLRFANAQTTYYEEDRILVRASSQNNELVINDDITIEASLKSEVEYDIIYSTDNFGNNTLTGITNNSLILYEGSLYKFNIDPSSQNISISFYTPSVDVTKQREYFDVDIERVYDISSSLISFTLKPDSSDLTNLLMRITSLENNSFIDVSLNIIPEPINGEFKIVNSSSSFFEFYIDRDPISNLITKYNTNTIRYTTTSKNASGAIHKSTLTSGGFNYTTVPEIKTVNSQNGNGAILEAISNIIGRIDKITSINSGYGYSPDPTLKPSLVFPKIAKITNNFIVSNAIISDPGEGYLFKPRILISGGGLADGDIRHAVLTPVVNGEKLVDIIIDYPGVQYSSAPEIVIEKFYYTLINSSGELSFKFNYRQYIQENDGFIVRAYYTQNNTLQSVDSTVTFYAYTATSTMSASLVPGSTSFVNPLDYINLPNGISAQYYEVILNNRRAQATVVVDKSTFIEGEKVIINSNKNFFGYISRQKGWQPNNSILRIEQINYELKPSDTILGVDSDSFGIVEDTFGVTTSATLSALVETPKQFLSNDSFLGLNSLKLQDSLRYQKFAYEIGTTVPFSEWKQNYQNAAHPSGYNLFAKTNISNKISKPFTANTKAVISTNVSSIVRINQKYNYLIARNVGLDEVEVINRLLTDVKSIKTSAVAAFEDISDQFDGIETSFELKVVDPVTPTDLDGNVNYITDYEPDQMIVSLDNIIQTYNTSWIVTDSDKVFKFQSSQDAGELMPEGEQLTYRQFNEDTVLYNFSIITSSATDTFSIFDSEDIANPPFPSSVYSPVDPDEWFVTVDGAAQHTSSFTITTNQIQFTETLPAGTQLSVRYINNLLKNEFGATTYTTGSPLALTNKPTITSKESYFVFVDGILMSTSLYSLDANNDIEFNINFSCDSILVIIDPLGVSLETSTHNIIEELYTYKIEDGQLEVPLGYQISSADYMVDIAGVVQTPVISYTTSTSGVRKINFFEPPQRYVGPDSIVGRQFVGLLYQRLDATGDLGTTPNYQFDDVSQNIISVKEDPSQFIVGDFVNTPTSSAVIVNIISEIIRKTVTVGFTGSVNSGSTFQVTLADTINITIGDRVYFNASFGLGSVDNDELEITAINRETGVVTIENISAVTLSLTISDNTAIRFTHYELIVEDIETTVQDREDAFNSVASGYTLESGIVSAEKTGITTLLNEPYSTLSDDLTMEVDDASGFSQNDYLLINNTEVVKITNISTNTLTIERSQLNTNTSLSYGDGTIVEKIIPKTLTTSNFRRGFDKFKTDFVLKENGVPIFIEANRDIFVVVNGILQKRGPSYSLVEVDPDGNSNSGDEYSELRFTEAPADGTPFNCFYLGELISIQDISGQFNGIDLEFDLRSVTGEIFSLISNGRPEANVAGNLILFMDGVYQIPSTTEDSRQEAYPDSLASFKLLGSVIQFTSPPKAGSTFEGYIYVGSIDDYESIDIDATVESEDIIIQYNEIAPRTINNVTSATKLSVDISSGQKVTAVPSGINLGTNGTGWWKSDLIKVARVRESLRARRCIPSEIVGFDNSSPYPLSGKTLYTISIPTIELANISSDLPQSPDDDTNVITLILPATTFFSSRMINAQYTSFVPRNPAVPGDTDKIQGVKVGYDLSFDQIIRLSSTASTETFESEILNGIVYSGKTAKIINWDITTQLMYIKLDDPASPVSTSDSIKTHNVINDDLINEYQSLAVGNKSIYNF